MPQPIDNLKSELELTAEEEAEVARIAAENAEGTDNPTGEEKTPEEIAAEEAAAAGAGTPNPFEMPLEGDDIPEKFQGKTVADVMKSYSELEAHLGSKSPTKEEREEAAKAAGIEPQDMKEYEELQKMIENQNYQEMDPAKFAMFIIKTMDGRSAVRTQQTVQGQFEAISAARSEAEEAKIKYPMLKTNKGFRELVISAIESAQASGQELKLDLACENVMTTLKEMGAKPEGTPSTEKSAEEIAEQKKRATIEGGTGAQPEGDNESEADEVKKGMLAAGSTNGPVGGL